MSWKKYLGNEGEVLACRYLQSLGMQILARNWRYRHYELDIIAKQHGEIHVIEVKTRRSDQYLELSELVRRAQVERILTAAQAYIETYHCTEPVLLDLLIIITNAAGTEFEFYPDAFHDTF